MRAGRSVNEMCMKELSQMSSGRILKRRKQVNKQVLTPRCLGPPREWRLGVPLLELEPCWWAWPRRSAASDVSSGEIWGLGCANAERLHAGQSLRANCCI